MADVNTEVLNAASQDTYGLDFPGGLRKATGINKDPNGICLTAWGKEFNEAGTEMLSVLSAHALLLDGASGSYASTPDVAALDITGDIDLRVEFVFTTPAGNLQNTALIGKWNSTGNQKSYELINGPFALPTIFWSANGSAELSNLGIPPFSTGGAYRATLDVDNGASGNTSRLYAAASMDGTFVQFDEEIKAGVTSIFASTAALTLGAVNAGTAALFRGRITRAQVRNGIDGTIVANPDFRNLAPGTTSFADSTGKTWTVHGTARVV
jgi:hypothetical protein